MTARLVVGTAQLRVHYGIANASGPLSMDKAIDLIRSAASYRVAAFDTAPGYGDAEYAIGLANVDTPVYTKLSPELEARQSVERSLQRLRRTHVDIAFVHEPNLLRQDPEGRISDAARLVGSSVSTLGVSTYEPQEFQIAVDHPSLAALQAPISVADRRLLDGALDSAAAANKPVFARSVYLQGALLMPPGELPTRFLPLLPVIDAVDNVAARSNRSRAEVLVVFVRDLPGIAGLILGCETKEQLAANVALLAAPPLSAADRGELMATPLVDISITDPRHW